MLKIGNVAAAIAVILLSLTADASRVIDSAFEYRFDRAECLSGLATDSSDSGELFGNLNINTSAVICKGLGVEAKAGILEDQRIVSSLDSSLFVEEISRSGGGWTFEAWITFTNFTDCTSCTLRHMVSVGSIDNSLALSSCGATSNIFFYQLNAESSVGMRLRRNSECLETTADYMVEWGSPMHVVLTMSTTPEVSTTSTFEFVVARWYIDGQLVQVQDILSTESYWLDGFYLQLLNDAVSVRQEPEIHAPPGGTIFLLAMYSRPLNSSEVARNYDAGLQNSPPLAGDITISINEDGEVGDHYRTPEYYLQDPTVPTLNLSTIYMTVEDLDDEEGFPGFNASEARPAVVAIESLPSRGTLFDINGNEIDFVPWNITDDNGYRVRYRPVKDEFSGPSDVYASFTYSGVDGVTGEKSLVSGTCDIFVLAKNDPPVPMNVSEEATAGTDNVVVLGGTDVDNSVGDKIEGALVVELPDHGVLYQVRLGAARQHKCNVRCG